MNNDLKDLSTQELLDLARTSEVKQQEFVEIDKHVLDFVKECKIVAGTTPIPNYLIFYKYRKQWRSESRTKLSKIHFFRNFNKLFDQYRTAKVRNYLLNKESFDTGDRNYIRARNYKTWYEKTQKKNKTRKSK